MGAEYLGCSPAVNDGRPFGLPADSVEITLDLPMPPSINRLWRISRPHKSNETRFVEGKFVKVKPKRIHRSEEYVRWMEQADMRVMATKKPGRLPKISGPFEVRILLNEQMSRADGDNVCAKAVLDFCQSRDIIRNDSDCRRGSWEWVEAERAPRGCRVVVRSLHEAVR